MIMRILRAFTNFGRNGGVDEDALYRFAKSGSREKKKILKEAVEIANEEQRKIYYSHASTR